MPTPKPQPPTEDAAGLAAGFAAVGEEAWRRRVEEEIGESSATLAGETREGLDVPALFSAESCPRSLAEGVRPPARGWRIAEEYRVPELRAAARDIQAGQRHGVELLWLAMASSRGASLSLPDPVPVWRPSEVERLMAGVDLAAREVVIETGGRATPAAALWLAAAERLGFGPGVLRGAFACDPFVGRLVSKDLSESLEQRFGWLAELVGWTRDRAPGMRCVLVSTERYHEAGASAVDELALAIASGVECLRRLTAAGLAAGEVARRTLFAVSVGSDVFVEIAKLRALRLLWAKVLHAAGVAETATFLHARGSARTASRCAPRTNLLRAGAQAFAAAVGGADSIAVAPFDEVLGRPEERSRRLAVMTQHVLRDEAHLGRVADPAGGSWCVEALTDRLARSAWKLLQELERDGGMASCLADGRVRDLVRRSGTRRYQAATHLRDPLVGVSAFADLGEPPWETKAEQLLSALFDDLADDGLRACRLAAPFERLRDASEKRLAAHGSRPRAFLARFGESGRTRAAAVRRMLAAAGIESADGGPFEGADRRAVLQGFRAAACEFAVLCAGDELYPELAAELYSPLQTAGARWVMVAGRGGEHREALLAAGIDDFLFEGCDLVTIAKFLYAELEDGERS